MEGRIAPHTSTQQTAQSVAGAGLRLATCRESRVLCVPPHHKPKYTRVLCGRGHMIGGWGADWQPAKRRERSCQHKQVAQNPEEPQCCQILLSACMMMTLRRDQPTHDPTCIRGGLRC
jgi:hypothetical protein